MLPHNPVMVNQMIQYLMPNDGEHFLDCTFGAGGYSAAILESCKCNVTAVDKDPTVISYAKILLEKYNNRFNFLQSSFGEIAKTFNNIQFNGIVVDLGVSSMQLDTAKRGFSFMHDGPLDMRMSIDGPSAADFINNSSEAEIADVIYKYGDETAARKIAKHIVYERKIAPIATTGRLAGIVRECTRFRRGKIDNATKTFQAIRIFINHELEQLQLLLSAAFKILIPKGRLVIVSFHSLEDRIIKEFFKANSAITVARSKYAKLISNEQPALLSVLTKKPINPVKEEISLNPRSRSAKLRAAVKV